MSDEVFVENNNIQWAVWSKPTWAGAWNPQPAIMPTRVKFALAPDTNTAQLIINRGLTRKLSDPQDFIQLAEDIIGHYIQIRLSYVNGVDPDRIIYWTGVVPAPVDSIDGSFPDVEDPPEVIAQGLTTYNCYGLEWFMMQTKTSFVYKEADVEIKRMIPFNYGNKSRNNVLDGNRSTNVSAGKGIYTFSDDGELWTAKNVLDHLIQVFNDDVFSGSTFVLTVTDNFAYQDLNNVVNSWSFEHISYMDAINQIINPAYGFSWQLRTSTDGLTVAMEVASVVDIDIEEDGSPIIRANQNVISDVDLAGNGFIEEAIVKDLENHHYDKIIVQGERLRCSFTMEIDKTGANVQKMKPDWFNEVDYENATDKERTQEIYDAVYQRFLLHQDWDGKETSGYIVLPTIDVDTGTPTTITAPPGTVQEFFLPAMQLDRNLPQAGLAVADIKAQRRPFVIFADSGGVYVRADKTGDDELTDAGLRVLDDAAGIQMDQQVNHLNALNEFSGSSETDPQYDFDGTLVTVSMYTDERVRVEVAATDPAPFEVERILRIDAPGLHVWHAARDTVKSFDGASLERYGAATLVRDDSAQLLRLASLANAWYGRKRSTIDITYGDPFVLDVVGSMLESADTGGVTVPVGTIISMVEFKLNEKNQKVDLGTSFRDFNFNKVLGLNKSFESINTTGQASMDELQNINVRQAPGGGGGGSSEYDGPWACRKDPATAANVEIGFNRTVLVAGDAAGLAITDNIQLGFNNEQYAGVDSVLTTFDEGIIYVEITTALAYSYEQQQVTNAATSVVLQGTGFLRYPICRYRKRAGVVTNVYQIQQGPIHYPGSAL